MALDAAHRSSIYQKLVPLLGPEDANVLMSEFPSAEADELVTKQFLRAEMAALELRLTDRITALDEKLTARYGRQTAATIAAIGLATAFLRLS